MRKRELIAFIKRCFRNEEDPLGIAVAIKELEEYGIAVSYTDTGKVAFFEHGERFGKSCESSLHIACPFCGFPSSKSNPFLWCSGCYVQYYRDEEGDFVFDPNLQRDEYRWAIALAKVGGARIGSK